jgi:hypothetical protein
MKDEGGNGTNQPEKDEACGNDEEGGLLSSFLLPNSSFLNAAGVAQW